MAFGFVQNAQGSIGGATTLSHAVNAVKTGDLIIVNIKFAAAVTSITITDNASTPNIYALAIGPIVSGGSIYQFYGVAVTGGATNITANWATSTSARMDINEFSGGMRANATVFDRAASSTGSGTSASLSLSPSTTGELVTTGLNLNAGASAVTGGANYVLSNNNNSLSTSYRLASTTFETAPISWTTSVAWAEIACAYKPLLNSGSFMPFFK